MTSPLTLFTTCKPFEGKFALIQRNALRSWKSLQPACEVIVFGDEPGVSECCEELGFRHVPVVSRNEYGTPLLDGLFDAAEHMATSDILALVNADIMLTSDLIPAVERVRARFRQFLLITRRWNVEIEKEWDFESPEWESQLRLYARAHGTLESFYGGVDLFVYPRGTWKKLSPFAIGRFRWDSALIRQARELRVPVVDATEVVTCLHPIHDYSHHPEGTTGVFRGPEAVRNVELMGGEEFVFTPLNATHLLTSSRIHRKVDFYPPYLLRRLAMLTAVYAPLHPLAPVVLRLAPWWRKLRRLVERQYKAWRRGSPESDLPYLISISPQPMPKALPPGGGVEVFDTPEAVQLNRARIDHLRSLGLPLRGRRVLDVGCGVGHLAQFFVEEGCEVLCVDGRKENIDRLRSLYPHLQARVFDLETDSLSELGRFDIVFAYGTLYHLENPFRAIRSLGSICDGLLLIETMVADHHLPVIRMAEETSSYNQALQNVGSRPTPSFIVLALRAAGFQYIYAPHTLPDHPDFRFAWEGDLSDSRDGHLLRCIFVASRDPLVNLPLSP